MNRLIEYSLVWTSGILLAGGGVFMIEWLKKKLTKDHFVSTGYMPTTDIEELRSGAKDASVVILYSGDGIVGQPPRKKVRVEVTILED